MLNNYQTYDATALANLVRNKDITASELLDNALARYKQVNSDINAVVLVQEAAARAIIDKLPKGALSGVPFLLKDLGAAAIDFPSHNGSRLTKNTIYQQNSTLYERIAATGLVTFGRTTAPESGIGATTEAAVYGGPTRNPWNLERSPGGSSGGAAAAIAAGIIPAAHGSDGGGSIRIPASCCGLFGFKASRGRLPKGPNSSEGWGGMAIDGFLTRSVRDSALLLDLTQGYELGAPYCAPPLQHGYVASLVKTPTKLKVALCDTTFLGEPIDPECKLAVNKTAKLLESLGHDVEFARPDADIISMLRAWTKIVACGVALDMKHTLSDHSLKMTDQNVEGVTRGAIEFAKNITGEQYLESLGQIHKYTRDMAKFFDKYDILLTATLAEPPAMFGRLSHETTDFYGYRFGPNKMLSYAPFTASFNATGQPAVSIPMHHTKTGLPVGVQLAAAFGQDEMLMALCARIEEEENWFNNYPKLLNNPKN